MDKKNKPRGQFADAARRFKRNRLAMAALVLMLIIIIACVFADVIAPYNYAKQDITNMLAPVSWKHICGTDNYGRDLFSRILKGGQISLLVAFAAVLICATAGIVLGSTAAYFGGICDAVIMRFMDIIMAIPGLLIAAALASALGNGIEKSVIAIAVGTTPGFVRIMYSSVLSLKEQEFIEAAKATGASTFRIIMKYIVPNCIAPIIVQISLRLGTCILMISSLSFIGLGVQPPTPEWGSILNSGREFIRSYWPIVTFPGIAIALTLIAFNCVGDGIRDALDPRLKD